MRFVCCINIFNDTFNEVLLPQFSGDVMTACGVESPGVCESALDLRAGSIIDRAIAVWAYICLALLYGLAYGPCIASLGVSLQELRDPTLMKYY